MTSVREIFFPTDLTAESDQALEHVRLLGDRFKANVTLYHAVEMPDPRYAHWAFAHGSEVWARAEEVARDMLQRQADTLGGPHKVIVERQPSASRAIIARVHQDQPDLTVMATHAREGLSRLLLGSVAAAVISHSFRPVLCVREPDHGTPLPYKRVLVPTDLSLASRLAFPLAALFARTFGAEVIGLHVRRPYSGFEVTEGAVWSFLQQDFAGLPVTAQVHTGTVWDRIVETARVERTDVIVMATRGHDTMGDRVLGSNTDRVTRHAPCPVVVA
jgi:nucleotide-binding universal stress UspA family protein